MNKRAIAISITGFLTIFTAFSVRYSYGILLPEMLIALTITKTQAGLIYSSYFIAYTACSPAVGVLSDRYNSRILLTVFPCILGIAAFLMSQSTTLYQACLFFAIAGIGHSACWVTVATLVQRWVSDRRRGTALTLVELGSASGIIVWSIAIPHIVYASDWRMGWISLGIQTVLITLLNFIFVKNPPRDRYNPEQSTHRQSPGKSLKTTYGVILGDVKFWLIGLSYLLVSFCILIPFTFLSTYGVQELNLTYQNATLLVTMIAAGGILGKLALGPVSDIIGRIRVLFLCGLFIIIGGLGMAYSREFIFLGLSTFVFGIGYGALWLLYAACARDFFDTQLTGTIIGLWTVYHGIGSILSPVVAGWAIDKSGTFHTAFYIAAISAVISALLLVPLLKTSHATPDNNREQ
jgi:sugar phosphate permease